MENYLEVAEKAMDERIN